MLGKAILRAMDSLKENPASWNSLGSLEDLEKVTPENLFKYYKEVLNHDYVDIYVVGDLDMDEVNNTVSKLTKFNVIKNHKVEMYVPNFVGKFATFSDKNKSAQSNIVVILNLKNLTKKECYHIKSTLKYIITLDNIINTPYFKYLNNYCKLIIITI